ncbi:hypothetical protein F5884DRAFT_764802 [Xylogone sp. PMI_703]|nr:hypothetical protein F5884DRAFT_764802 [Xylogone sp. PMI_703]
MSRRLPFSKLYTFALYSAGIPTAGLAGWLAWSRNCYFEEFTEKTDDIFRSPYLAKYNPWNNTMLTDSCVRTVPLAKIKPGLVEDTLNGGSRLVETYCGGMFGGYGYAIQRQVMKRTRRNEKNASLDLWERDQLLHSTYEKGTEVTGHLMVLEKNPRSIIMRGGDAPREQPEEPGEMENLSEICVEIDQEKQLARFKMKNLFFCGAAKADLPFPSFMVWLHYQYCKLLVESGVSHCRR